MKHKNIKCINACFFFKKTQCDLEKKLTLLISSREYNYSSFIPNQTLRNSHLTNLRSIGATFLHDQLRTHHFHDKCVSSCTRSKLFDLGKYRFPHHRFSNSSHSYKKKIKENQKIDKNNRLDRTKIMTQNTIPELIQKSRKRSESNEPNPYRPWREAIGRRESQCS